MNKPKNKEEALALIEQLKAFIESKDNKWTAEKVVETFGGIRVDAKAAPAIVSSTSYSPSRIIKVNWGDDRFCFVNAKTLRPWANWGEPKTAQEVAEYLNERGYYTVEGEE